MVPAIKLSNLSLLIICAAPQSLKNTATAIMINRFIFFVFAILLFVFVPINFQGNQRSDQKPDGVLHLMGVNQIVAADVDFFR
jgi:hypothetical protein